MRDRSVGDGLHNLGEGVGFAGLCIGLAIFLSSCFNSLSQDEIANRQIRLDGAKSGLVERDTNTSKWRREMEWVQR